MNFDGNEYTPYNKLVNHRPTIPSDAAQSQGAHASRPDLTNPTLRLMLLATLLGGALLLWLMRGTRPGEPVGQLAAFAGTVLLLVPLAFSILKRSNVDVSTPTWFGAHVVCANLGAILIAIHIAGGSLWSPAGLIVLALLFLLIQGTVARTVLAARLSELFAASPASFNFATPPAIDREALQAVIDAKQQLLPKLKPGAREATFSPTLAHWLTRPDLAFRYQQLVRRETALVGARQRAGVALSWWRPLHIAAAAIFIIGLLAHLIVMLLFAGYAAGDETIYWWHIASWGAGR